jgi:type II secretory pathway component PulK
MTPLYAKPPNRLLNSQARCGFVLTAVLWMVLALTTLALVTGLVARSAIASAQARMNLTRAEWRAEACVEIARSVIAEVLKGHGTWLTERLDWTNLDSAVLSAPPVRESGCDVDIRPTGLALDVNRTDGDALRRLLRAAGLPALSSDTLADAILAWRDSGTERHTLAVSAAWYDSAGQFPPRHGLFADVRELHRVHGYDAALERLKNLDTLLTTEHDRIWLTRAPLPVLSTIRGLDNQTAARIIELRSRSLSPISITSLAAWLSSDDDRIGTHHLDLNGSFAVEPDAWIVTARGQSGTAPAVSAWVELRLVRAGRRAAIVRRRIWP